MTSKQLFCLQVLPCLPLSEWIMRFSPSPHLSWNPVMSMKPSWRRHLQAQVGRAPDISLHRLWPGLGRGTRTRQDEAASPAPP